MTLFSADRAHRFTLDRSFLIGSGKIVFIGLNPSIADENRNDPTVRRELDWTMRMLYREYVKLNLFSLVSTDPLGLLAVEDPTGDPENLAHIIDHATEAKMVVAAWGEPSPPKLRRLVAARAKLVATELEKMNVRLYALSLTKSGAPRHPLYLKKTCYPFPWAPP